jgi:hypothetical protein
MNSDSQSGVFSVDHRPEVAAFLYVDLEQVAQVVERRGREPEMSLLLDRRRLRVALRDDDAAQVRAVLSGHVLPDGLADLFAEMNPPVGDLRREKDAPAIVRHLHVVEVCPAGRMCRDRGAQVDVVRL